MLATQNLLREEMQQKDFFKEQASTTMQQLVTLQEESQKQIHSLESGANRHVLEVRLIEEKNAKLLEQIADLTKKQEDTEKESNRYKKSLQEKQKEVEEMQMQMLQIKSETIEKDGQIADLVQNLAEKGQETAMISSQYLDLKNYILDQQLFETKYSVTRVPISEIVQSPNVRAALASPEVQKKQ